MDLFHRRKRAVFVITAISCIALSIITLNFRAPRFFENIMLFLVTPAQNGVSGAAGWLDGRIEFISNMHELERDNRLLAEENQRLLLDVSRLQMLERENERLTAQIGLRPKYVGLDTIGAYVIAADPNNWSSHFLINRGTSDEVTENMVVLADGGLVGRVLRAYHSSSLVIPIIDDTSVVSAQIRRTGDFGFVSGDMRLWERGFIRMENIHVDADVLENDEVITSTTSEIFPHGIIIGTVREINVDPGGLTKHAIIQPIVDFRQLSVVLVATNSPGRTLQDTYDISDTDVENYNRALD